MSSSLGCSDEEIVRDAGEIRENVFTFSGDKGR